MTRFPDWPRSRRNETHLRHHSGEYERQAIREALDFGLTVGELAGVLGGRGVTEVVPPRPDEDPREYGCRAASEIMVRYILAWPSRCVQQCGSRTPCSASIELLGSGAMLEVN